MTPKYVIHADADALAVAVAEGLATKMQAAIAVQGRVVVVLAGGRTPRAIYEGLAHRAIDWERVVFAFGDERCVPPDDPASNYRMANEALFSRLAEPPQVLRIAGESEAAAESYMTAIAKLPFDIVLIGLGEDGHVASIFPETLAERHGEIGDAVVMTTSPVPPVARVSLTLSRLVQTRALWMVVSGSAKASILAAVEDELRPEHARAARLPASRLAALVHEGTDFEWHVDEAAAADLRNRK